MWTRIHQFRTWVGAMAISFAPFAMTAPALAVDQMFVTVTNTTGLAAADLHVTFSGTGGNISVHPFAVIALGCPVPVVPSNGMVTNEAVIKWSGACVPPGSNVSFLARTTNGPMAVVSGFWTNGAGAPIGAAVISSTVTLPPPPFPWLGMKVQTVYQPPGPPTCTPWQWNGMFVCRRCCWPARACWYRIFYCPFSSRTNRFFELPPWIPIVGWTRGPDIPAHWSWRWWDPWHGPLPQGPPPNNPPPQGGGPIPFSNFGLLVRYSDDSGITWRQAADLTSTNFAIRDALDIPAPTPTGPVTFSQTLMAMAPLYAQAANALPPLITEINNVLINEPSPTLQTMLIDTQLIQLSLTSISAQLSTGAPNNPTPFFDAANAYASEANVAQSSPLPRYQNTAPNLSAISGGFFLAGQAVAGGLDEMPEEGNFVWSIIDRIPNMVEHVATGSFPNMRVQFSLPNWMWFGFTMGDMHTRIQLPSNNQIIDEFDLRPSEFYTFDVPVLQNGPLRIEFKLPTHLSRVVEVVAQDGLLIGPISLVPGDANGDNCIDADDLSMVVNDQGQGGWGAPAVPSSDVNGDGIVDEADVIVVQANFGQCGEVLPLSCTADVSPPPNGDGVVNASDLLYVINNWGVCPPPCPPSCRADVAPPPCIVNTGDLLFIINHWGPCP